jgi:ClpP class serine protease
MKYARIAAHIFNKPLLIEPGSLLPITNYLLGRMQGQAPASGDRLEKLEARRQDPEVKALAQDDRPFGCSCGTITDEGIAVISITGELVHRHGGVDADSGLLSYVEIERRLDAAQADPRVRGTLLDLDSPGGEAAGCFSLADKIYNSRGAKPIWALVNESACSAAFALASATSRVLLTEGGHVGSVGVIWQALDQSQQDKALGLRYTVIQFGARKNDFNPHFPISKEALDWAQPEVDRMGEQFVALVARNRGIKPQAVRDTEAGLLFGPAAVQAGFADAILEPAGAGQTLVTKAAALLAAEPQMQPSGGQATPAVTRNHHPTTGAKDMTKAIEQAAGGAQAQPASDQATAQDHAAALDAARAEGTKAGATAERARIAAILNHPEAKGREAVAQALALQSDMTAEAVAVALAATPKANGGILATAMGQLKDPDIGSPDAPQAKAAAGSLMTDIMASRVGGLQKGAR